MKDDIKEKIKAYYIANDIDKILDYITNLQEDNVELRNEVKELERMCELYGKSIYNAELTNLQEEIHKKEAMYDSLAVDYRLSQEENERLKKRNDFLNSVCVGFDDKYEDYKSRNEKTINLVDRTIEIIKQQPTKDDSWILSRLYGFKFALNGGDEE